MDGQIGSLDQGRDWLREAPRITVLTGAGISTDSGIPDFRGPQGTTRAPYDHVADAVIREPIGEVLPALIP